jgi:hypothetical protein
MAIFGGSKLSHNHQFSDRLHLPAFEDLHEDDAGGEVGDGDFGLVAGESLGLEDLAERVGDFDLEDWTALNIEISDFECFISWIWINR